MPRGLGWLQREILEAMQAEAPTVYIEGTPCKLYSTRSVLRQLSKEHGQGHKIRSEYSQSGDSWSVYPGFQASFSRALHSLVRRGELVRYGAGPQLRFVGLPQR
jgi:hypothetical protein